MGKEILIQGNSAIAESAIRAGCKYYFGYPITPSSEIAEYYAVKNHQNGVVYVQAETEMAAFNMVAGVASVGKLGMTATSGPGFCLGVEVVSFMASAELPAVFVDCMRPGPGDGEILAAQGDYFQVVKGGGHGDYHTIVLAPYSVQELADYTVKAFELAVKYRNPVILLSDGALSKQYENVILPDVKETSEEIPDWALRGASKDNWRSIVTCGYGPDHWEKHCMHLQEKFKRIENSEQIWDSYKTEDADVIVVAYGSLARVALDMVKEVRAQGMKVGMIRPITLWPFPKKAFENLEKPILVTELSAGQMVEDVKLSVPNHENVHFYGKLGGNLPTVNDLKKELEKLTAGEDKR